MSSGGVPITFETIMDGVRSAVGMNGYGANRAWPPPKEKPIWQEIEAFRRRYKNNREELLPYAPHFSSASDTRKSTFTPVPLAKDICRLSSQLLFSEDPQFLYERDQDGLNEIVRANELEAHLQDSGEKLAYEGVGALRVFWDERALSEVPVISYVSGDQIIWELLHGRFVRAGTVVMERRESATSSDYYRLLERHEPGKIQRKLYRGQSFSLGKEMPLETLDEFAGLLAEEDTMPNVLTLVRWPNVPNGLSDLSGLDTLLDRVDEGVSYGVSKMRKSDPWVAADKSIAGENGTVDLSGVVFAQRGGFGNVNPELGATLPRMAEVVQPGLDAQEHVEMVESFVNLTLEMGGYSRASWGRDGGGSADSGKALRLRQVRTLQTRAGKDRMAKAAIRRALAIAYAWRQTGRDVEKVAENLHIVLGDGYPEDTLETSQELATLEGAGAISTEEKVRRVNPGKDEDAIQAEVERIRNETAAPTPSVPSLGALNLPR